MQLLQVLRDDQSVAYATYLHIEDGASTNLYTFFQMLSAEHHTAINISFFIDGADYEEILPVRYDTPVDYLATNRARALQYAFLCPQFELPIQAQSHKSKF